MSELYAVLNTVLAGLTAAANLWGAARSRMGLQRLLRISVMGVALYIGAAYTAYLLDIIPAVDLGSVFLRPALAVFLFVAGLSPLVDAVDPVERIRAELEQTIADLHAKNASTDEQLNLVLRRLAESQTQVDLLRSEVAHLRAGIKSGQPAFLLVAVGDDPALNVDLSVLRKMHRVTGVPFLRISPATKAQLERKLERDRAKGQPVRWLHLSVHSDTNGVEFADGVATWGWLSEILADVEVLVIAGCRSDRAVDQLGVVGHVVAFSEEIENRDAMIFAEAFWTEMARSEDPDVALSFALDRSPPVLREFVERNW